MRGKKVMADKQFRDRVTPDEAAEATRHFGGTVLKTSLSKADEQELQEALHGQQAAAQ
jgi:uncharacterized membrane protein